MSRRTLLISIAAISMTVLTLGAWRFFRQPEAINVVLITLDTTRADRIGCYGYANALTPALDALAARGVLFEVAYTPVPLTLPAHASLLTGLEPPQHGARLNGIHTINDALPTLATSLSQAGYDTAAFVAAFVLDSRFGLDRGFSVYNDDLSKAEPTYEQHLQYRDAGQVVTAALNWLDKREGTPFFCWMHMYEPHHPYVPHATAFAARFVNDPYDGEIAYVDRQVGRVVEYLERHDLIDNTLFIVAGDHGESLGEHGEIFHGMMLYESALRVPLIVCNPAGSSRGRRVSQTVSLVDLYPSVLDCLGLPLETTTSGRSLKPVFFGGEIESSVCYGETQQPYEEAGWSSLQSLRMNEWKYIRTSDVELYNLATDPMEQQNLAAVETGQLAEMEDQLAAREQAMTKSVSKALPLSDADRRALESLGYTGGGGATIAAVPGSKLPDVKQMIGPFNRFREAVELTHQQNFDAALPLLEAVVEQVPDYFQAQFNLGICYARREDFDKAAQALRQALKVAPPGDPHVHTTLAKVYIVSQQADKAVPLLEAALAIDPRNPEIPFYLGDAFRSLNRNDDARRMYQKALQLDRAFAPAAQALGTLPPR